MSKDKLVTVQFVQDYRGMLTGETYYQAGATVQVRPEVADQMVADGRAELVDDAPEPDDVGLLDLASLKELRALAKQAGVKGYSRMKRETLIDQLS